MSRETDRKERIRPHNGQSTAPDEELPCRGTPVTVGTISIGGGAAPYTIAGCMTHSLATDFAGMVLSQLIREGSFCIGCSENSFMEPATGNRGNEVPELLADMAMRQVRSHYGLPPSTMITLL